MRAEIAKGEKRVGVSGAVRVATETLGEEISESTIRVAADKADLPSERLSSGQRIFEVSAVVHWAEQRRERRAVR